MARGERLKIDQTIENCDRNYIATFFVLFTYDRSLILRRKRHRSSLSVAHMQYARIVRNRGEFGWQIDLQTVLYETDTTSLNASKFISIFFAGI